MALRLMTFINDQLIEIPNGGLAWNHGKMTAQKQLLINRLSAEAGRNGELYSQWVLDGQLEDIYWFSPTAAPEFQPARRFFVGGDIVTDTVAHELEDTDYLVSSLWTTDLTPDGWAMITIMTDRVYPAEYFTGYAVYNLEDWE